MAPRSLDPSAPSVGLYHNRNRWLSPELGRFLQRDPNETTLPIVTAIAFNGDSLAIVLGVFSPQGHYADGLNLYAYLGSNPLNLRDPLGLVFDPFEDVDEVIGSMYAERIVHAQDMMVFFVAMGEMAAQAVIEGMISVFVPGGVYLVMGYHLIHAANDIEENGLNFWNGLEAVGSAIPLGGALWRGFTRHLDDLSRLRPPRARASGRSFFGVCFVAGTAVLTPAGPVPIESLNVGQRVLTTDSGQPTAGFDAAFSASAWAELPVAEGGLTQIDPTTWRLVEIAMPNPACPDDIIRIRTLRPLSWMRATGCEAGRTVWYTLPEMGLEGPAVIRAIQPCPPIEAGPGRVVLSTVTHLNSFVLRIWLEGQSEPLEPTNTHRLYSEDAGTWVPAGELAAGERLRTRAGPAKIVRIDARPGTHRVYNLEVETEHSYYVSTASVLSHNANPCGAFAPRGSNGQQIIRFLKGQGWVEAGGTKHVRMVGPNGTVTHVPRGSGSVSSGTYNSIKKAWESDMALGS